MLNTILVSALVLLALAVGFAAGYLSKGISVTSNITVTKPDPVITKDANGNQIYNESLLDLMPKHVREELDTINRG